MLAGAGLGDDAGLAHAPGKQNLAHDVVDLVGAGMVEFVALEVDLRAAEMSGEPLREIERRGPADIMLEKGRKLGLEGGIGAGGRVGLLELQNERHQGLGHVATAEPAEMAMLVRARPE